MRRVSLARMDEDRVCRRNDSSGKGEVEEYAPSFSPGVQMGVIIIITCAQSSPVKSVHPTSLHSCLVWPEAEARDVPEAPLSALLRSPLHHVRLSCVLPRGAQRRGRCLRGPVPPHPRASPQRRPVAADWAECLLIRTALAPALPALPLPLYLTL